MVRGYVIVKSVCLNNQTMIKKLYKPFPNGLINISDWWYTYPSKKYEFVSWDDSSQLNGQIKNIPNHHNGTTNSGKKKRDKEPESP